MKSFCDCAREHHWDDKVMKVVCACGRVVEPQTDSEFKCKKEAHERALKRMAKAIAELDNLEPTIRFFST